MLFGSDTAHKNYKQGGSIRRERVGGRRRSGRGRCARIHVAGGEQGAGRVRRAATAGVTTRKPREAPSTAPCNNHNARMQVASWVAWQLWNGSCGMAVGVRDHGGAHHGFGRPGEVPADHRNLAGPQRARYLMGIRDGDRDDLSVGDRTFWRGLWRECLWECDWGGSGGWGLGGLGGVTQSTVSAAADTKTTARVRTLMNMAWVVLAARDPGVAVSRSVVVAVGALATVPPPRRLLLLSAIRNFNECLFLDEWTYGQNIRIRWHFPHNPTHTYIPTIPST